MSFCFIYSVVLENHSVQDSPWGRRVYKQFGVYMVCYDNRHSGLSGLARFRGNKFIISQFQIIYQILIENIMSKGSYYSDTLFKSMC